MTDPVTGTHVFALIAAAIVGFGIIAWLIHTHMSQLPQKIQDALKPLDTQISNVVNRNTAVDAQMVPAVTTSAPVDHAAVISAALAGAAAVASAAAVVPAPAKPVAAAAPPVTYDARAPQYKNRGDGMADWIAAGRPDHDAKGRELDTAGWPTGSETATAAVFDPVEWGKAAGMHFDPTFASINAPPQGFDFPVAAGSFTVAPAGGAQDGDMHFTVSDAAGTMVASDAKPTFTVPAGTLKFSCVLNADAKAVIARAGVARGSYNLYPA